MLRNYVSFKESTLTNLTPGLPCLFDAEKNHAPTLSANDGSGHYLFTKTSAAATLQLLLSGSFNPVGVFSVHRVFVASALRKTLSASHSNERESEKKLGLKGEA